MCLFPGTLPGVQQFASGTEPPSAGPSASLRGARAPTRLRRVSQRDGREPLASSGTPPVSVWTGNLPVWGLAGVGSHGKSSRPSRAAALLPEVTHGAEDQGTSRGGRDAVEVRTRAGSAVEGPPSPTRNEPGDGRAAPPARGSPQPRERPAVSSASGPADGTTRGPLSLAASSRGTARGRQPFHHRTPPRPRR